MNQLITNDNWLLGQIQQFSGAPLAIVNGNFELGTGSNTAPPGWDIVLFTGGTSQFSAGQEGDQAFQFNA
ncbi:MAG TPA: hypothetical protein VIJ14_09090, partial [Rhabdochlamydiaceae bacterium]